jgi:hypothetical protein
MKLKKQRIATIAALSLSLAGLLAGCELIVDFDRTKIDGGTVEGGGNDVVQPDGSLPDSGTDGTVDTGVDTGTDGTVDTGTDTGIMDTGADVPDDTSPD